MNARHLKHNVLEARAEPPSKEASSLDRQLYDILIEIMPMRIQMNTVKIKGNRPLFNSIREGTKIHILYQFGDSSLDP